MATPEEKKRIVADFLRRCNEYANGMIERYRGELEAATGMQALEIQDKISHWTAYRAFNEYAIEEMYETTEIDDWFAGD